MRPIQNIFNISVYETRILLRSAFFRIFSILTLVLIVLFNMAIFSLRFSPWMFRAIPASIPYLNLFLLNLAQAAIAVFLASDFLKYDNKLDTTETIYIRSMTNAEYVFGKFFGVLSLFFIFNLAVLLVAWVFNVFFADVPVVASAYVLYPLLISLPTLIFIFGLSFFVMILIGSQAITFILLLGYIGGSLFFLSHVQHYILDFTAMNVPLMYSDFIGFGNLVQLLMQRGIYILVGLGFVCLTTLMLRRLSQSKFVSRLMAALTVICFAGAGVLGFEYLSEFTGGAELRAEMRDLNTEFAEQPRVTIDTAVIDLDHAGETIDVSAYMTVTNETGSPIGSYLFSLNPGLQVTGVTRNGAELQFDRNVQLVTVQPGQSLAPGAADSLVIRYRGAVNEDACYLDIPEDVRSETFRYTLFSIGKRYAAITPDYVLLTPESIWYPISGIVYGGAYPYLGRKDYVDYTLRVRTDGDMIPVAQGAGAQNGDVWTFQPEVRLPRLSLAMGRYEIKSVTVDDVDYSLYVLEGHDYFSEYFSDVGEQLAETISNTKVVYEDRLGLTYPYKRMTLVEAPVQFYAYPRQWTLGQETVQPEMIFLPEKGVTLNSADFKRSFSNMSRRGGRGGRGGFGGDMSPEDMQGMVLRGFINSTFQQNTQRMSMRFGGGGMNLMRGVISFIAPTATATYAPFPMYYAFSHNISSPDAPIFNMSMELYMNDRTGNSSMQQQFMSLFEGLTDVERANLSLSDRSFADCLADPPEDVDIMQIIKNKSLYLFTLIETAAGADSFRVFLDDFLAEHVNRDTPLQQFTDALDDRFGFEMMPRMEPWMNEAALPAILLTEPTATEIFADNLTLYQVRFTLANTGNAEGIVTVDFRIDSSTGFGGFGGMGGGRGGGMMMGGGGNFMFGMGEAAEETAQNITLGPGEAKDIGIVVDGSPREMTIDTHISQNLPSTFSYVFSTIETDEDAVPFEDEVSFDADDIYVDPSVVIVDNEDPGFSYNSVPESSILRRWLAERMDTGDQYTGIQSFNPPRKWTAAVNGNCYGTIRKSAYYIHAGKGDNVASWTGQIPRAGRYALFIYIPNVENVGGRNISFGRPGGGRGGGPGGFDRRRGGGDLGELRLRVHHEDGVDDIVMNAATADEGWNVVGSFFFSEGDATVELTDKSDGRIVIADAVRWVAID